MYNYRYILHTYICMCISIYTYYFALFWLTGLFCFIYWLWFVFSLLYIQLCFIMLVYKKVKIFVCSRSFFPFASVVRLFLSLCVERVCPNCTLHIVSRYGNLKKKQNKKILTSQVNKCIKRSRQAKKKKTRTTTKVAEQGLTKTKRESSLPGQVNAASKIKHVAIQRVVRYSCCFSWHLTMAPPFFPSLSRVQSEYLYVR